MPALHVRIPVRRRATARPPGPALSTRLRSDGSRATVLVAGEIDLFTAPELLTALEHARLGLDTTRGDTELLVDLCEVTFLSAAGLRVLAFEHILCIDDGTTMRVVSDQYAVRRPMELTGLERLMASR